MFGAAKLAKHPNIDQYNYSGYGIENVITSGVDMSWSPYIDNEKRYISILDLGLEIG